MSLAIHFNQMQAEGSHSPVSQINAESSQAPLAQMQPDHVHGLISSSEQDIGKDPTRERFQDTDKEAFSSFRAQDESGKAATLLDDPIGTEKAFVQLPDDEQDKAVNPEEQAKDPIAEHLTSAVDEPLSHLSTDGSQGDRGMTQLHQAFTAFLGDLEPINIPSDQNGAEKVLSQLDRALTTLHHALEQLPISSDDHQESFPKESSSKTEPTENRAHEALSSLNNPMAEKGLSLYAVSTPASAEEAVSNQPSAAEPSPMPVPSVFSVITSIGDTAALVSNVNANLGTENELVAYGSGKMGDSSEENLTNLLNKAEKQLEKLLHESGWSKFWHNFAKPFKIILQVVVAAVLVATQQYAALGMWIASKVVSLINKATPDNGGSKSGSNIGHIVKSVLGTVANTIAAVAGGRIGAAFEDSSKAVTKVAKDAAKLAEGLEEGGIEMVDFSSVGASASDSAEDLTVVVEEGSKFTETLSKAWEGIKTVLSKVWTLLKKLNVFQYLPDDLNRALFGLAQGASSTHLTKSILDTVDFKDSATQKKVEGWVEGSMSLLSGLVSAGVMLTMVDFSSTGIGQGINQRLFRGLQAVRGVSYAGMATAQGGLAFVNAEQARLAEQNGIVQADIKLTEFRINSLSTNALDATKSVSKTIESNLSVLSQTSEAEVQALYALAQSV